MWSDLKRIKVGMMISVSGVGHGRLEDSIVGGTDRMVGKVAC